MQRRPTNKHTPFRDRREPSELESTPSSSLRFNNENENTSNNGNPIIQIRRKGKGSSSNANIPAEQFECRQDYLDQDEVKRSHYLNQNQKSRCHSQENLVKLTQSQEIFFRRPQGISGLTNLPINSSLTFGSMKQCLLKNSLSSNQEFQEDKKMKNEILDQIIKKSNKLSVVKSQELLRRSQRPEATGPGNAMLSCANQDGKKAKYRVMGDQDEEELFYCSKCSIMLLQQGFRVEEITRRSEYSRRRKDCEAIFSKITDLQGRLKYHMNSLDSSTGAALISQSKGRLEETYDIIMFIVEQMKARDFQAIDHAQEKLQTQRKREKGRLFDRFSKLDGIREELQRLISSPDLTQSQMVAAVETYSSTISSYERYEPVKFEIEEEPIEDKLQRLINEVSEHYTARKVQFSFQTDSQDAQTPEANGTPEQPHKPFRNLFPEDSSRGKRSSRYYNGEFIEEEDDHFSPSFKKEN